MGSDTQLHRAYISDTKKMTVSLMDDFKIIPYESLPVTSTIINGISRQLKQEQKQKTRKVQSNKRVMHSLR